MKFRKADLLQQLGLPNFLLTELDIRESVNTQLPTDLNVPDIDHEPDDDDEDEE